MLVVYPCIFLLNYLYYTILTVLEKLYNILRLILGGSMDQSTIMLLNFISWLIIFTFKSVIIYLVLKVTIKLITIFIAKIAMYSEGYKNRVTRSRANKIE